MSQGETRGTHPARMRKETRLTQRSPHTSATWYGGSSQSGHLERVLDAEPYGVDEVDDERAEGAQGTGRRGI
jgi:hypothetical protein